MPVQVHLENEVQGYLDSLRFLLPPLFCQMLLQAGSFHRCYGFIYHHNGIIDIAAFYEVIIEQHFQLMQKTKSTAGCYFCFEIFQAF